MAYILSMILNTRALIFQEGSDERRESCDEIVLIVTVRIVLGIVVTVAEEAVLLVKFSNFFYNSRNLITVCFRGLWHPPDYSAARLKR